MMVTTLGLLYGTHQDQAHALRGSTFYGFQLCCGRRNGTGPEALQSFQFDQCLPGWLSHHVTCIDRLWATF